MHLVLRTLVTVVIELLFIVGDSLLVLALECSHNLELAIRGNRGRLLGVRHLRLCLFELELGCLGTELGRVDVVHGVLRLKDVRILKLVC